MTSLHEQFVALHQGPSPLLLANAWDAASARLWQEAGAKAIATTSAAVAWARGYADGGALPREVLLDSLRDVVRVTSVPVTADVEDGYGDDPESVASFIAEVAATGAVGINLEDGGAAPEQLAAKIRAIRARLSGTPLFINARTDVYLRGMATGDAAIAMTIERLRLYSRGRCGRRFRAGAGEHRSRRADRRAGAAAGVERDGDAKPAADRGIARSRRAPDQLWTCVVQAGVRRRAGGGAGVSGWDSGADVQVDVGL